MTEMSKHIQKRYPEGQYLYKSCSTDDDSWIVILELTADSITNQSRLPVDDPNRRYAKFRTSKAKVIDIVNKFDRTKTIDSVINSGHPRKINYVKGTIVRPDSFDRKLREVCSNGIHFFESIDGALHYELNLLKNYTGYWIYWDSDGQKENEGYYSDGKRHGHWTYWYNNGRKECEGEYLDDKIIGKWTCWHDNGLKKHVTNYI